MKGEGGEVDPERGAVLNIDSSPTLRSANALVSLRMEGFKLHPRQQAFLESSGPLKLDIYAGGRSGRKYAVEALIAATAPTEADRRKLLADLHEKGYALQGRNGKHVPTKQSNGSRIEFMEFDEEKRS